MLLANVKADLEAQILKRIKYKKERNLKMKKYKKGMIIDVLTAILYNVLAIYCVLIRAWELAAFVMFFAGMTFAEAREKVNTYFMAKEIFEQAKELEEEE